MSGGERKEVPKDRRTQPSCFFKDIRKLRWCKLVVGGLVQRKRISRKPTHLPRWLSNAMSHEEPKHEEKMKNSSSSSFELETEEDQLQRLMLAGPSFKNRKRLSKQLSMCETPRDVAWEKRRRQILRQERRKNGFNESFEAEAITDEDLNELKGCIELGFGFNEEDGHGLCNTLPALDLYFAVNRQFSTSPVSTPSGSSSSRRSSLSLGSPRSDSDYWKICNPGDDPEQVKTKLRHWAQAVACSMRQTY